MFKVFRSIRQHIIMKNQTGTYLKYAIGEIILVVIGILIALQINTWNEGRKDHKQEQVYLNRLLVETKEDILTFTKEIKKLKNGIETITLFSEALKNPLTSDDELLKSAENYFRYGSLYPTFSSSTSTFDDLSSTGNLKIIRNTQLRDLLVKHYAKHKETAELIRTSTEWALPVDGAFTYEHSIMRFEPSSKFLFPTSNTQELSTYLRNNRLDFINMIASHYWLKKDAIDQINDLEQDTKAIIEVIEQELNTTRN